MAEQVDPIVRASEHKSASDKRQPTRSEVAAESDGHTIYWDSVVLRIQFTQKTHKGHRSGKAGKLPKGKKQPLRFTIGCATSVIDEDIVDIPAFETYLKSRIKVNGKIGNLGRDVRLEREKSSVSVVATIPFSKRYLKYLTKKYLKRSKLRDYLRVVATNKDAYELRFFNFETEDTDDEDES